MTRIGTPCLACIFALAVIARATPESDLVAATAARLDPKVGLDDRRSAARWLYGIRNHIRLFPSTVAVLIEKGLSDSDKMVRQQAARTLGYSRSQACVAPLVKSAREGDPEAALALGRLGAIAKGALPMLHELSRTGEPKARVAAARAIHELSGDAGPAATVLAELAEYRGTEDYNDVRWFALYKLGPIGPGVATAAPSVRALLDSTHYTVRPYAIGALLRMGVVDTKVVSAARKELSSEESSKTALHMLDALRDAGPAIKPVARDIVKLLERISVSEFAAYVIGGLGDDGKPYLNAITKLFESRSFEARASAAEAHWRISRNAKAIIPVMRSVLRNSSLNRIPWYSGARRTLDLAIQIGPPAAPLKECLTELTKQDDIGYLPVLAHLALEALRPPG